MFTQEEENAKKFLLTKRYAFNEIPASLTSKLSSFSSSSVNKHDSTWIQTKTIYQNQAQNDRRTFCVYNTKKNSPDYISFTLTEIKQMSDAYIELQKKEQQEEEKLQAESKKQELLLWKKQNNEKAFVQPESQKFTRGCETLN